MSVVGVATISISLSLFFSFDMDFKFLEIPPLIALVITLMVKMFKYMGNQKRTFISERGGNEVNKESREYLEYKSFHRSINYIIIMLLIIYTIIMIIGLGLGVY